MAYVYFDSNYAPCAFLIVKRNGDPYNEEDTILCQLDWDYPGFAMRMGWSVNEVQLFKDDCSHSGTDGTIICTDCGTPAINFINSAYDHIYENQGEEFPELDEYFEAY